ncbi:MAG: complex I NDUFA12 subunit family protein [Planctomycetaceae bacterium]|nr:complex I NDUFA12 subunit family protein [Planctomycetaceae bacterium]
MLALGDISKSKVPPRSQRYCFFAPVDFDGSKIPPSPHRWRSFDLTTITLMLRDVS